MFSKKYANACMSILWVMVWMLSVVQPVYAAPAAHSQAAAAPAMLQFSSGGYALGFSSGGMLAATGEHALKVDFVGANAVQPQSDQPTNQPGQAAALGRVSYSNLWNGISLDYSAEAGSIYMTTYHVAAGANPGDIRLHYNVPVSLNSDGTLGIAFQNGTLNESAPVAWQDIDGQRVAVAVAFRVEGQDVNFSLGVYNPIYALTIDPILTWNTFLGGNGADYGSGIAVDGSGNVYVVGRSSATWGTPVRAHGVINGDDDVFVAKLSSSGTLVWNTFLGNTDDYFDNGNGIAVDDHGNVYVTGRSDMTWGAPVRAHDFPSVDGFVAKLNPNGTLAWNTFLGGTGTDYANGITVDGDENVYVTGSSNITWGYPVRIFNGALDAFVVKLDSNGVLSWNTFLGNEDYDEGNGIALDGSGNVVVAGYSYTTWGTPVRAHSSVRNSDVMVVKLNSNGGLLWNTFLGGTGIDDNDPYGITLDGSGNIYVSGTSFAAWGTPVRAYSYDSDDFVAKLNSSGALLWNTFLGSSGDDQGLGMAVDNSGNVYVTGYSDTTWGTPVIAFTGGDCDAFIAKLNSNGALTVNAFLGSSNFDGGSSISLDKGGNIYITGTSYASWGSPVRAINVNGAADAFVAKLALTPPVVVPFVTSSLRTGANPSSEASVNFAVTFSQSVTGVDKTDFSLTTTGMTGASVSSVSGSGTTYTVAVNTGSGNGTLRLNVIDDDSIINASGTPLGGTGTGNGTFTSGQSYSIIKTTPGPATLISPLATIKIHKPTYIWSKVTGSTYYRIWVNNSAGTLVNQGIYLGTSICGDTNCAVTPTNALVNGTYTWYIQTLTATQNGTWAGHTFVVAAPTMGAVTLVSPKGTTHLSKPTFIWSKDPVATLYRLWVKNVFGIWVIQNLYAGKNICGATNCAIVSPITLSNGSYTWYIQTLTATQNGQWSGQPITVSAPDKVPGGDEMSK